MKKKIDFILNGRPVMILGEPTKTLLDVLRNNFELKGVKICCNTGDCGACTVIVEGKAVRSCLILIATIEGKTVETIEAIGRPGHLHPLQEAFLNFGATQCGYCTPGMILTAKAFLEKRPDPTRKEIAKSISGNICRCTGYTKIIDAIEAASAIIRERG